MGPARVDSRAPYTATLLADNSGLTLRPGMTATASILSAQKNDVLLVPHAALRFRPAATASGSGFLGMLMPRSRGGQSASGAINRGSQRLVYVLREDGELEAVPVRVGASANNLSEVSGAGLSSGVRVVSGRLAQAP